MESYTRSYPLFSLCGLACALCPRYHTSGTSRCPGCGGPGFSEKHPPCKVISCARKHGGIEFCYQCAEYPCGKYEAPASTDSFITYQHAVRDLEHARKQGLASYQEVLEEKVTILEYLLAHCNDGRHKSRFCTAVNLLDIQDLREIMGPLQEAVTQKYENLARTAITLMEHYAHMRRISLKLRKPQR